MKGKKKSKDMPRRRRGNTVSPGYLQQMQLAAAGVALWGKKVLEMLPHGFENFAAGKGKKWTDNKRVLILVVALLYFITRPTMKSRLLAIPLTALLVLAIQQHRASYESGDADASLVEVYK